MATNLVGGEHFSFHSSLSMNDDFFIPKILLTHGPDGRHLDSKLLLRATENVMRYATISEVSVSDLHTDASRICNIEVVGSEETLGHTIFKISRMVLCKSYEDGDIHTKTVNLFDMLGYYTWDAKVVLILAAFAMSYGEFWLIMQLYLHNPLAASIAVLKQLPSDLTTLKPRFKALSLLVTAMVEVTKCIIKFETLPLQYELLDSKAMAVAKSQIYIATYWILRSSLACFSQITELVAMKKEHSDSTTIAAWGLSSLALRLSRLCSDLRRQVDMCHQQIETRLQEKLMILFKETHVDNQDVLHMLFALKDDLPLKNCSSEAKHRISELKNKVVILLVSKPELLPIEQILLVVQQIYDHPYHKKIEGSYEIVWVPLPSSDTWTLAEETSFFFLSNSLPWLSIRQPWSLRSAVVNFIKQEWNFKEEPLMVVLDLQGMITNSNAFDMVMIWGARAFPFSTSREKELWGQENWTLPLLIDGIDPLLMKWVEDGKNLCIYGSDNLDWFRDFNSRMKEIKKAGVQLEVIYAGWRNPSEHIIQILTSIDEENLNVSLPLTKTKINFFWLRLESMKKSILNLGHPLDSYSISKEVSELLDINDNKHWVLIGMGSSTDMIKLHGKKVTEWFDLFPVWAENVPRLGLVGAIRAAFEPQLLDTPCHHSNITADDKGIVLCDKCKRPMEKFVIYICDVTHE